jgi:ferrous iron transport protein A
MPDSLPDDLTAPPGKLSPATLSLGAARRGLRGYIVALDMKRSEGAGLPLDELERRLIELGFVEGARVELIHEGLFGRDPIAIRVADTTIALRRREAMAIVVRPVEVEASP